MVCALCEYTPDLVQAEAARLCPAVLLSIDDTDPIVLPPVWEAVLHVVSTIPVSFCYCCYIVRFSIGFSILYYYSNTNVKMFYFVVVPIYHIVNFPAPVSGLLDTRER